MSILYYPIATAYKSQTEKLGDRDVTAVIADRPFDLQLHDLTKRQLAEDNINLVGGIFT